MRNMSDIKKAVLGTAGFILSTLLLSAVIMYPYLSKYMMGEMYFQDAPLRKEMAGTLDFLIVGASHGCRAFDTSVLDEQLYVNSYNLGVPMMTLDARFYMMKKEVERNEVSTVVIEVSYDMLRRDRESEGPEGILTTLGNLDNNAERWDFFTKNVLLKEYGQVYYQMMDYGIKSWVNVLRGKKPVYSAETSTKGFKGLDARDMTMTREKFFQKRQVGEQSAPIVYKDENCRMLEDMIEYCQNKGIRVILCVIPVSEGEMLIYNVASKETLDRYLNTLSNKYGCEAYNFNLIKDRVELFSEATAFYDTNHLSMEGADTFTQIFCRVITDEEPESYFLHSYDEVEQQSAYVRYLR